MSMTDDTPLLAADGLTKWYGRRLGCTGVSFDLYEGEVLAIVGLPELKHPVNETVTYHDA